MHMSADVGCLWGLCMSCCIYVKICTKAESAACACTALSGGTLIIWFLWGQGVGSFGFWFGLRGPPPARSRLRLAILVVWNAIAAFSCCYRIFLFLLLYYLIMSVRKFSASVFFCLIVHDNCFF